jgi:ABC-2 type transport system ATP-binding protein
MNLMTGLIKPKSGRISVLGTSPDEPEAIFQNSVTVRSSIRFRAAQPRASLSNFTARARYTKKETAELTEQALERVSLRKRQTEKFRRSVRECGSASGSRSQSRTIPSVLVLDEPLNGLDPMARAEIIRLFRQLADAGMYLVISSHILHEVI